MVFKGEIALDPYLSSVIRSSNSSSAMIFSLKQPVETCRFSFRYVHINYLSIKRFKLCISPLLEFLKYGFAGFIINYIDSTTRWVEDGFETSYIVIGSIRGLALALCFFCFFNF